MNLITIAKKYNISYFGDNFKEWFGKMEVKPSKVKLKTITLERDMLDKEILSELKPKEITLGDLFSNLKTADKMEWYIAYIRDKDGVLRAVVVFWDVDGWFVRAYSVGYPGGWFAGYRVFSCDFDTLTPCPSDPLFVWIEMSDGRKIKYVKE
jgi:hypothetical protein